MADKEWFERTGKKFARREWEQVASAWLEHVPPGGFGDVRETNELRDLPAVIGELRQTTAAAPRVVSRIDGLGTAVLGEALFLIERSAHVLGAAQLHVGSGMCTWSTTSAYHAAFFAAQATMRLLMLATAQTDSASYAVDLWPEPEKRQRRGDTTMIVRLASGRLEHRPVWSLFQRLLRVTSVPDDLWDKASVDGICDLDVADFASRRNAVLYRSWPLDDLRIPQTIGEFGVIAPADPTLDETADDFPLKLAICVVRLADRLVADLAKRAPILNEHVDAMNVWKAGDHYPVYRACVFV